MKKIKRIIKELFACAIIGIIVGTFYHLVLLSKYIGAQSVIISTALSGLIRDKELLGKDFSKLPGELKVKLQASTQRQLEEAIKDHLNNIDKSREATVII